MNRKAYRGFTLVELLVVIAVIAVLAAILFPVFIAVRRQGYTSVCSSNLRNFGAAFRLYAADWGGRFPLPGGGDGTLPPSVFWLHSSELGESMQIGGLWPYIRTRLKSGDVANLWSCPLAARVDSTVAGAGYSPGQNYIMNDYVRSGHSGQYSYNPNYPGYFVGLNPDACPAPSRLILLYEGVQDRYGFCARHGSIFYAKDGIVHRTFRSLNYPNIAQNYHNGKSNFLFVDGHVKLLNPAETWTAQTRNYYRQHRHFAKWLLAYPGSGTSDMWNPRVSGVNFP